MIRDRENRSFRSYEPRLTPALYSVMQRELLCSGSVDGTLQQHRMENMPQFPPLRCIMKLMDNAVVRPISEGAEDILPLSAFARYCDGHGSTAHTISSNIGENIPFLHSFIHDILSWPCKRTLTHGGDTA